MRKHVTRLSQFVIDIVALSVALVLAFELRFDWSPSMAMWERAFVVAPYAVLLEYACLRLFQVHRQAWRYVSLREMTRILLAVSTSTAVLVAIRMLSGRLQGDYPALRHGVIPLGAIAINSLLAFLLVTGVRVARRMVADARDAKRRTPRLRPVPTLLVGAGQAGLMVARELAARPDVGLKAIGFLDDDPTKTGLVMHGLPVLGRTDELARLCKARGAEQVLITMASVPRQAIRRIRGLCDEAGVPVKIIPGVYEIVDGRVNLSRIRDVALEDLLGRTPVQLDLDRIEASLRDAVVLVTGAGGSIGSEICRQVARFRPASLVLVEHSENNLFYIHRELSGAHPTLDIVPRIGDITDAERMREVFTACRPAVVFHAAAHKHVPMMEWNPVEAIKNNVLGTRVVADLAHALGARTFVMISTDKAVNPSSVMGATKRVAELYVQARGREGDTRFVTVRFGNVLGSAGSVVPIFKAQIEQGGPVTVTHPDMTRYFMTIPEACQLVLEAGTFGSGGEIFILDMGEPVKIVDLARDLIKLSGFVPDEDIEIRFLGARPGEKLFEELSTDDEHASKTAHPKIFIGHTRTASLRTVGERLDAMAEAVRMQHTQRALRLLAQTVPEARLDSQASLGYLERVSSSGAPARAGTEDEAATHDDEASDSRRGVA
ncbi:MAG: polysaccharide biosynthesis protein [Myxococcales bacterium]|nr:polysaccharide biosynthesis protein [Myxococcales bacterium]